MGQLIHLKPEVIKPSQNFLKPGTINFILGCFNKGEMESLPPAPMVRKHPKDSGVYIAIDGHNLLAVHEHFNTECEVYLVDSSEDNLPNPEGKDSIFQRNTDLKEKYESCVEEADKINCSFKELAARFIGEREPVSRL